MTKKSYVIKGNGLEIWAKKWKKSLIPWLYCALTLWKVSPSNVELKLCINALNDGQQDLQSASNLIQGFSQKLTSATNSLLIILLEVSFFFDDLFRPSPSDTNTHLTNLLPFQSDKNDLLAKFSFSYSQKLLKNLFVYVFKELRKVAVNRCIKA